MSGDSNFFEFGFCDRPLYKLERPWSPTDDPWDVQRLPDGQFIAPDAIIPNSIEDAYSQWTNGSAVSYGDGIIACLFAAIFGTESGVSPQLNQPFLGTGILNLTGHSFRAPNGEELSDSGLWFFPFSSRIGDGYAAEDKDPVLIIPEESFIIDSRGPNLQAQERWKKHAHRFAQLLARGRI